MSETISYSNIKNTGDDFGLEIPEKKTKKKQEPIIEETVEDEPEPEPEIDDPKEVMRLRLALQLYINEFPDELSNYRKTIAKVDQMSLEELKALQQEISLLLGMSNMYGKMSDVVVSIIGVLEVLSYGTPMKLKGYADKVKSDKHIMADIKLMCLDLCSTRYTDSKTRVALSLTTLAYHTHTHNSTLEKMNQEKAKPIIEEPKVEKPKEDTSTKIVIESTLNKINLKYSDL